MKIKQVLNDSVLVRMKNQPSEMCTNSGIFLVGVEQDYYIAEVVMVGPGKWTINKKTEKEEFIPVRVKPSDFVVLEKNFHHVFNVRERWKIEHTIEVDKESDEYSYYLTKDEDIYLKFDNAIEAQNAQIFGELYSIMKPKSVQRASY